MRDIPVFFAACAFLVACGSEGSAPREASESLAPEAASVEPKIAYWVAPMDPTYISDKPGKSPMGMDLVPVYEDAAPGHSALGGVSIDPRVVQNMGVRIVPARRQTVFRHVRSIGEIEVGEDQVSAVNLRFSGWVERIRVDRTGDPVEKGQPLFEVYSPELVTAQQEYLLALRTRGPGSALARSARRKLELWDVADAEVQEIVRAGKVRRALPIRSPRTGFVLDKNIVEGARTRAGEDLYRIADLSRIWVTAEVYEFDAPWVEVGQSAQMELSFEEGRTLEGTVAYIYPTLNPVSRTLTVRLEFENPEMRLKPGMFATVYIQHRRRDDALAVPTEAIIDSGRRKIVFVSIGDGRFEPREIATGLTGDHHVTEVLSGLEEGDLVVVSGQFLLDSESQLQEAIGKMAAQAGEEH
jgi:Cu(I)/Ag(I) efflux system membrane fusion protein/cobalt-zinc-cadmium efflux system membrane fusion protein